MAQMSTKSQDGVTSSLKLTFDGGINYSESPSQIGDNELTRALNIIYNSQTGTPEVRPGTICVTATPLASPIIKLYAYEQSPTIKYTICASGGKLYRLSTGTWIEIGTLNDNTTVPSFLTYNTILLIADGGVNLKKWNGTTLTSLSDGLSATAIAEIAGRVVINSVGEPDLITFSGAEDETQWDTAAVTNPALGIRCGFGDNMNVNGFAVFGTDVIVSKRGDSEKRFYRVGTSDPIPTNWTVSLITENNCAQNAHTMSSAFNNIFFVDLNGFKSIQGVTAYGDLQIDLIGAKVNTQFQQAQCYELTYLAKFTALWYCLADRIYAYHRVYDADGQMRHAFTDMQYSQGSIRTVMQLGDDVYLAGTSGYLYRIDNTSKTDEISPDVFSDYPSVLTSKRFSFTGGIILKRTLVEFKALEISGTSAANIKCNTVEHSSILLKTVSVKTPSPEINDATMEIYVATDIIGDTSGETWVEKTTNRARGKTLQFQIDSVAGRYGIESLQAEISQVGS